MLLLNEPTTVLDNDTLVVHTYLLTSEVVDSTVSCGGSGDGTDTR